MASASTSRHDMTCAGVMGATVAGFLTAVAISPRLAWQHLRVLVNL